ncbi:hypothetical protein LCGC14_1789490 [marine sediment metagenome]|uniref:Uncharacterized protein n=1 Tax=marine sediment metagenome TaxID=412755 RepID=A0A0F9GSY7_9ZZZZ
MIITKSNSTTSSIAAMIVAAAVLAAAAMAGSLTRDKTGTSMGTNQNGSPQTQAAAKLAEPRSLPTERAGFEPAEP